MCHSDTALELVLMSIIKSSTLVGYFKGKACYLRYAESYSACLFVCFKTDGEEGQGHGKESSKENESSGQERRGRQAHI